MFFWGKVTHIHPVCTIVLESWYLSARPRYILYDYPPSVDIMPIRNAIIPGQESIRVSPLMGRIIPVCTEGSINYLHTCQPEYVTMRSHGNQNNDRQWALSFWVAYCQGDAGVPGGSRWYGKGSMAFEHTPPGQNREEDFHSSFMCLNLLREREYEFALHIIPPHWNGANRWNLSSRKTRAYLCHDSCWRRKTWRHQA